MDIYLNIIKLLIENNIEFDEIDHDESHSCDESKEFREKAGLIGLGSKNIVFHAKGEFYLVITHGDKIIRARNFKHEFKTKDIRFATQEEISGSIGATIGSIPPFGFQNSKIFVYIDSDIFDSQYFIFNPADPKKSIRILSNDLKKIYSNLHNPLKVFKQIGEDFMIE